MHRVLLSIAIIYCCGLLVGAAIKPEPLFFLLAMVFSYILSLYMYFRYRKAYPLIYICIFLSSIFAYSFSYKTMEKQYQKLKGRNVTLSGVISGDITNTGNTVKYTLYADSCETDGICDNIDCKINVIDYNNDPKYVIPYNDVKISGKFESGNIYKNTNMANYQETLFTKGISGTLIADYSSKIESVPSSKRFLQRLAYDIKRKCEAVIERYVDKDSYALAKGVIFGDTSKISDSQYISFEKAGIIHIFAVSGYNIWLLYYILNHALFFINHHKRAKTFAILSLLLLYTIISGWSASIVRAFIMASVSLIGKILLNRDSDKLTSLSISCLAILISNPLSIMDIGFQLSFISVLSIILIFPKFKKLKAKLPIAAGDMLAASISVQIGITPMIAYHFNTVSTLSVVSNVFIMPLVSLFTILLIAILAAGFVLPYLASAIGSIAGGIGGAILKVSETISSISWAGFNMTSPSIFEMLLYYGLLLALCSDFIHRIKTVYFIGFMKGKYKYMIALAAACMIMMHIIIGVPKGMLKISFIDVGQGDSILVSTPDGKHVLIDGGGKIKTSYSDFDIGEEVLKPYLLKHGIKKIDMMISTHSHYDHLLGLVPVMKNFEVEKFVKPEVLQRKDYEAIIENGLVCKEDIINVKKGDVIKVGNEVLFYVLNPEFESLDENDSSLVIKLVYKDFSALFTADAESFARSDMDDYTLKSDVLKIPHHGSSGSINDEFLKKVDPEAAVICVGKNNFGHPSIEVVDMVEKRGIKLYRTDTDGEITVTTDGRGFDISTWDKRLKH
jgi:competence protein ComEC